MISIKERQFLEQYIEELVMKDREDQIEFVKVYVKNHDINDFIDNNENTILHLICDKGSVDMIERAISLGVRLDLKNRDNKIPLFCCNDHLSKIVTLINRDPSIVNIKCGKRNMSYFQSIFCDFIPRDVHEIVNFLIKLDCVEVNIFCENRKEILLSKMFNGIGVSLFGWRNEREHGLWEESCCVFMERMKDFLVENMDYVDSYGNCMIHAICLTGSYVVLKKYLELVPGIDICVRNKFGKRTALHLFCIEFNGKTKQYCDFICIIRMFEKCVNEVDEDGMTALDYVSDLDLGRMLIKYGAIRKNVIVDYDDYRKLWLNGSVRNEEFVSLGGKNLKCDVSVVDKVVMMEDYVLKNHVEKCECVYCCIARIIKFGVGDVDLSEHGVKCKCFYCMLSEKNCWCVKGKLCVFCEIRNVIEDDEKCDKFKHKVCKYFENHVTECECLVCGIDKVKEEVFCGCSCCVIKRILVEDREINEDGAN